jgi:hypothetical protein
LVGGDVGGGLGFDVSGTLVGDVVGCCGPFLVLAGEAVPAGFGV